MIFHAEKTITRCTIHSRCPICGHDGWCQLIGDDLVQCMRIEQGSIKTIRQSDGSLAYLHRLGEGCYSPPSTTNYTRPKSVASVEQRDRVYQALLHSLRLPANHAERDRLRARGLTDDQIDKCGFGVFTAQSRKPWKIAKDLEKIWGNLLDVPGFLRAERDGNPYLTLPLPKDSLLIPVRNDKGQIEAIKCRKAEGDPKYLYLTSKTRKWEGPSAVQTLHVPKGLPLGGDTIRVTEGPLKADVTWHLSGVPTVGLPSATSWRCLETFLEEYPNFRTVILSLDADFRTNRHVGQGLVSLHDLVLRLGREVILELWDAQHGKGIDDVLLAGVPIEKLHDPVSVIEPLRLQYPNKTEAIASVAGSVTPPSNPSPPSTPPGDGADLPIARTTNDPVRLANQFLEKHYRSPSGERLLVHYQQTWYRWRTGLWCEFPKDELKAELNGSIQDDFVAEYRLKLAQQRAGDQPENVITVRKNSAEVLGNTFTALTTACIAPSEMDNPSWFRPCDLDLAQCLFTRNGIVSLPLLQQNNPEAFFAPTPSLFNTTATSVLFNPSAPKPARWLAFLESLWGRDHESISTLQKWFGYCLVPDTHLHKMMVLVGPSRSGKSTIASVLTSVLGERSVVDLSIGTLAERFGLWPLLNKRVVIFSDTQLSARADAEVITERIKSITGEDRQLVDRKGLPPLTTKLSVKFFLHSNEIPKFSDRTGVIANRMLVLKTHNSFLGSENHALRTQLLEELEGILLWAIEGWSRLQTEGFEQPQSGLDDLHQLRCLASRITEFVQERCELSATVSVAKTELYDAWKLWCERNGIRDPGSNSQFARDLYSAFPSVDDARVGTHQRTYHFTGIRIAD